MSGTLITCKSPRKDFAMSEKPTHCSRLNVEQRDDITIVTFNDRKILDKHCIQEIGSELFALVKESGRTKILINFSTTEYLSTAIFGKFITLNKMVHQAGGKLVFCSIDPKVYEAFEISRLNKLFEIRNDEQSAIDFLLSRGTPVMP